MKNLINDVAKIVEASEKDYVSVIQTANKFPKGKPAAMKDPVHVHGMGVMERDQAERLFPDTPHTSTKLYKEDKINEMFANRDSGSSDKENKEWERKFNLRTHRVCVTVSDPNAIAVTQRNDKIQKIIRVKHTKDDERGAVKKAKSHYQKQGYKIHSAEHLGQLKETPGLREAYIMNGKGFSFDVDHMSGSRGINLSSVQPKDTYVKTYPAGYEDKARAYAKEKGHIVIKHEYGKGHNNKDSHEWQIHRKLEESNQGTDHISMTVPLFIRCLEWAKESAKDDIELHKFVENVVALGGVLETDDYDKLIPEGTMKESFYDASGTEGRKK